MHAYAHAILIMLSELVALALIVWYACIMLWGYTLGSNRSLSLQHPSPAFLRILDKKRRSLRYPLRIEYTFLLSFLEYMTCLPCVFVMAIVSKIRVGIPFEGDRSPHRSHFHSKVSPISNGL